MRDGASATYALMLKSRILGENPLRVDYIFQKIQQFGGDARQAGGVVSIEMALWDIAGKAAGLPVPKLLGGKVRDRVRVYNGGVRFPMAGYTPITEEDEANVMQHTKCTELDLGCQFTLEIFFDKNDKKKKKRRLRLPVRIQRQSRKEERAFDRRCLKCLSIR